MWIERSMYRRHQYPDLILLGGTMWADIDMSCDMVRKMSKLHNEVPIKGLKDWKYYTEESDAYWTSKNAIVRTYRQYKAWFIIHRTTKIDNLLAEKGFLPIETRVKSLRCSEIKKFATNKSNILSNEVKLLLAKKKLKSLWNLVFWYYLT